MKGTWTLEYNTEERHEVEKFKAHLDGPAWAMLVWELDQMIRSAVKYTELDDKTSELLQSYRTFIHDEMFEQKLSFLS